MPTLGILGSKFFTKTEKPRVREYVSSYLEYYDAVYMLAGSGPVEVLRDTLNHSNKNWMTIPVAIQKWAGKGGYRAAYTEIIEKSDCLLVIMTERDKPRGGLHWVIQEAHNRKIMCGEFKINETSEEIAS